MLANIFDISPGREFNLALLWFAWQIKLKQPDKQQKVFKIDQAI